MPQTRAEEMMTASLEDVGVNVLNVSERDGGELRVIHQLDDDATIEDAELDIERVAGAFLGLYEWIDPDRLVGGIVGADGEYARTYYCTEQWAHDATAGTDPTELTDEGIQAVQATRNTLSDLRAINDFEALTDGV